MLLYEHDRTKIIVLRLRALSSLIQMVVIGMWAIVMGAYLAMAAAIIAPHIWWLGGILGIILGILLGSISAAALVAVIEWMAQMLVAQGEILESVRKKS